MTITVNFDPPLPSDNPATFNSKAFALLGNLNTWSSQANALAVEVNQDETALNTAVNSAQTSATTATTQAGIATTQAGIATTQASNALSSANAAAASLDAFDDRYLGSKTSNPTVDNDGNALLTGALYWNSTANEMRVWNGSAWVAAVGLATSGNTPSVLTVNSSSDALRITQTGSGNALYIEDVAADATPFVVSSTGVVGIGTTTPDNVTSAGIALVSNTGFMPQLVNRNKATDNTGGYSVFDKDRNGAIVQNGDVLGNIVFRGYDGAAYHQAAAIMATVGGAPGTNDMPGDLVVLTTRDGQSAPTESLRVRSDGVTAGLNVNALNSGQLAGMRNKIINGKMEIAQRGTSFAPANSGVYTLDRWVPSSSTAGVVTISQQADVPSSNEFQSSLRVTVTTADTSIAASDNLGVFQNIEGFNVRDLIGRTFTLSFWVRSSKTGIHCVSMRNTGGDRSYVAEYTINAANTWEYKSVTVSGGLPTAGTWNWTNGNGLSLGFNLYCGPTFQTTAGAWQTGNFFATANQVNCLDTIGNIFAITGVQLEVGSVATPFEHRPYGAELALCQRYYEVGFLRVDLYGVTSGPISMMTYYKATKRATPTVTYSGTGYSNASGITTDASSDASGFQSKATVTASGGAAYATSWQSAAEL